MWNIETRPRFDEWFLDMEEEDQANVRASLYVLADKGAQLGRPNADTLNGSKHRNMKELRVQSNGKPIRVFFAFDPKRTGIVLCGGDKTGDKRFYKRMIPIADAEYDEHLEELNDE
ncbi:type II toxin-antitoxin system RelE/ParE family toxin [Vibrio cyclitrophicus]|jgi:hypothetical protein